MSYNLKLRSKDKAIFLHSIFKLSLTHMKGKKTGGRQKGTPNKATAFSRSVIQDILTDYISDEKQFKDDLKKAGPIHRLEIMVKLAAFVTPKPQSVDIGLKSSAKKTIEDVLERLSEENEE